MSANFLQMSLDGNSQSFVWRVAHHRILSLPPPAECGWRLVDDLSQVLTTLLLIPQKCKDIVQCSCTIGCNYNLLFCITAEIVNVMPQKYIIETSKIESSKLG